MKAVEEQSKITRHAEIESGAETYDRRWSVFRQINDDRRAIRDFDAIPLADEEVKAVLSEALLAPSSGNSQPYVIYWLRNPAMKDAAAAACRNQRAARSASTLLVFACGARFAVGTVSLFEGYVESALELSEESRNHHRGELRTQRRFLRIAPSLFWSPIHVLLTAVYPALTLVPVGAIGVRNWAARSALFAAQNLMLAASARGLDTCPMEGFEARKLARIVGLRRGDVIPIVIALGRRRQDARIEPRWRRPFDVAVQVR